MIAKTRTATLVGIDALPVVVEVDLRPGQSEQPFVMVGLPDKAVEESKVRVRSAITHSELDFPYTQRVICNLAPGDVRKEGPALDLPIAIAILTAFSQVPPESVEHTMFLGELGLDGKLRPIDGALNVAMLAAEMGFQRLILPAASAREAAVATQLEVFGMETLGDVVALLNGSSEFSPVKLEISGPGETPEYAVDFADVKGQRHAIRALEIAAAGGHNVLMVGPPGSGKTMLARRLATILPPLGLEESVQVTRIYSAAGQKGDRAGLLFDRPFRTPHHTASHASIVGGGKTPKPGEVSLAHKGVLFLDEMPEFDRSVLEALRQPLEDNVVTVARVQATLTFPAECMLIGAMNPCPCGFRGLPEQNCVSSPATCGRYAGRISGPLLDRIDLFFDVPRLKTDDLLNAPGGEASASIRERVLAARQRQTARLGEGRVNAKMTPRELREQVPLSDECREFMRQVLERMQLSARVFDRILKVARTIADLAGSELVEKPHLAESVQFRERKEFS